MRVGLIGVGSIGQFLLRRVRDEMSGDLSIVAIADRNENAALLREAAAAYGCAHTTDPASLAELELDLVIEAASQQAVRDYAVPLVNNGLDLLVMSVGALTDKDLLDQLLESARKARTRIILPSGAIGGLDLLRAACFAPVREVTLTTQKSPASLAGAPFFRKSGRDSADVDARTVLFEGSAAEAASLFPANLNVAAALSICGIGFDETRVRVVADPLLETNIHDVVIVGDFGEARFSIANRPDASNPRTSMLAGLSILAALRRLSSPLQFG